MQVAPPEIYFVLDTISISTPKSVAWNTWKGIAVVSASNGTPALCAMSARAFRSATSNCGLVITSKKSAQVSPSICCFTSSGHVRSQKRTSTPKASNVLFRNE